MKISYTAIAIAILLATATGCKKAAEPAKTTTTTTTPDSTATPAPITFHSPIAGTYIGTWVHIDESIDHYRTDTIADTVTVTRFTADSIRFINTALSYENLTTRYDTTTLSYSGWQANKAHDSLTFSYINYVCLSDVQYYFFGKKLQ